MRTYYDVNGEMPCCTHDCQGRMWHKEEGEDDE